MYEEFDHDCNEVYNDPNCRGLPVYRGEGGVDLLNCHVFLSGFLKYPAVFGNRRFISVLISCHKLQPNTGVLLLSSCGGVSDRGVCGCIASASSLTIV